MGILNRLQLWWNWLTTDPLGFALYLLYFAVSVLLTLILHEIAHGYVAYRCGDPTAKMLGRLSLDPRKHLDPIGTLCLVFLGFGWAKPVPVNPRNFKGNYRRDDFLVSVAAIYSNDLDQSSKAVRSDGSSRPTAGPGSSFPPAALATVCWWRATAKIILS